jgi:formylglycine-generating enzyme required for sulfatase activity
MSGGDEAGTLSGKVVGGRYRVVARVSADEKGTAWLAWDEQDAREVILRVPDARFFAHPKFAERLREAGAAPSLPGFAMVLAVVEHEGKPCVVVERCPGGSLADRLRDRGGRFSPDQVLAWLPDAASALDALHKTKVIHRGVRPDGVLFDAEGRPRLVDCSIVRALGESDAGDVLAGLPDAAKPYVAPEAAGVSPLTPAFDQYGLAAVVYLALAGTPPATAEPQPLQTVAPEVSDAVSGAVLRALGKDPSRRHGSCGDFVAALRAAVVPAPAAPSSPEGPTAARAGKGSGDVTKTRRIGTGDERRAAAVAATGGRKPSHKKQIFLIVGLLVLALVGVLVAIVALEPDPPPKILLEEPPDGTVVTVPEVLVRGKVARMRPGMQVQLKEEPVPVIEGKFERTVPLTEEGRQRIVAEILSGGKPVAKSEVSVTYKAAWRPILDEVRAFATRGEWENARAKLEEAKGKNLPEAEIPLDVREGIARWEAPPEIALTAPADGTTLSEPKVTVKGTFSSTRATDRVQVDGREVSVDEDGRFSATVEGLESGKPRTVVAAVVDRGTTRRRTSVTVTYQKPPEVWESYLAGWAEPVGTETDASTGYPRLVRRAKDGAVMALVPAGTFRMGKVAKAKQSLKSELPPHDVTLTKAYYMDVAEVTIGQWKRYVAEGLGEMPNLPVIGSKDEVPVYHVNHDEANAYARWVGGLLPTEAQWERAAKGGHDDYVYPWGFDDEPTKRNATGTADDYERLAPVKSFPPNDYGLHDMAGNVWEWCADWYEEGYYVASPATDPPGPATGKERAVRGGGWDKEGFLFRASYRMGYPPNARHTHVGFRCVRLLP